MNNNSGQPSLPDAAPDAFSAIQQPTRREGTRTMADEPKNASSRRASDAGLEALLQEIEADAASRRRGADERRLEAFVGGFTASTFFATQDDGDAPLEVVPIPLPAPPQLSNLPDSLDFDLFELAQHELPSLLHYVLQDAGVLQRFAVPADALAGFLGVLQRLWPPPRNSPQFGAQFWRNSAQFSDAQLGAPLDAPAAGSRYADHPVPTDLRPAAT